MGAPPAPRRGTPLVASLARAYGLFLVGLAGLAGVLACLMFVLIVTDVTIRSFGHSPPLFTNVFVEYSLLYFAVLAAPWLTRINAHVFIDAVTLRLPPAAHRAVARLVYLISAASMLVFAWVSLRLLVGAIDSGLMDERGIYVPQWIMYAPMPLCSFLVALEFGRMLLGYGSMYARDEIQDTL